ncbi:MAG: hypothetical protein D6702_04315 [Planctomycetota bacterium]|nr:MAG: hypothetical protein D6702_04315 [Planctomycetota bacterium]
MKPLSLFPLLLLAAACTAPRPIHWDGPAGDRIAAELLAADRAFAAEVAADGLDGWMRWFAADAARPDLPVVDLTGAVTPGAVTRGLDAIREHDAPVFALPGARLRWEPSQAGVFADGRTGFTQGRWWLEATDAAAEPAAEPAALPRGWYLTWWRWQDGAWKVILDCGDADPPAAPIAD